GILEGTAKPDYKTCVAISTTAALHEMMVPGVMAVLSPLAVGIVLGTGALGGMLAGSLVTGVLMAIFMSNAGGAWDNAKKYIEGGTHGGKGSEAHKAAVVGDTVGDPFKDTSGPSINILIKLMTVVSLVFAPLFLMINSGAGLL
ncbi:MAG: sodium/proton-translocating pyrophosphatase, partial [Oscillospiraceae bacterium]|nr:sodium/proton-translocating pyrophosphatase [Oscillospiraceae bacterium]